MKNFLYIIAIVALFIQCNKPSDFGKEIIEGNNIPYEEVTISGIEAVTELEDSLKTFSKTTGTRVTTYLIGNYVDPIFGRTYGEVYFNMSLSKSIDKAFMQSSIDSAIFTINYSSDTSLIYGDIKQPVNFDLHRITETMTGINELYSNKTFAIDPDPIASLSNYTLKPYPKDSSKVRFKLNQNFIDFLKSAPDTSFKNDVSLLKYFHGICLKPNGTTGGMVPLVRSGAELRIFYKENGDTLQKSISLNINADSSVQHVHFEHEYTGTAVENAVNNPSSDSLVYLQGLNGTRIKLTLPDLSTYKGFVVNSAEIEISVITPEKNYFSIPKQLFLYRRNKTTNLIEVIPDVVFNVSNISNFGGQVESYVNNGETRYKYKLRLSITLPDIINANNENILYIGIANSLTSPHRVSILGTHAQQNPMTMKLLVSKIL